MTLTTTFSQRLLALVADAKASGARVLCGGEKVDRPGFFLQPVGREAVDEQTDCMC
jgi:acyl-CoA reductase-like NAD-dependent aldehyde dehydrogenase